MHKAFESLDTHSIPSLVADGPIQVSPPVIARTWMSVRSTMDPSLRALQYIMIQWELSFDLLMTEKQHNHTENSIKASKMGLK